MQVVLEGGFGGRPRESAVAFQAALDELARPGRVREFTGVHPPDGLSVAAAALLLTLADSGTPLWLPARLRARAVAEWLRFHTNAPQVAGRVQVMFAVGRWDELLPLENWPAGEPAHPDRSVTLIVEVATAALQVNVARFPLGLDFFFTAGQQVAGPPRSNRIRG